MQLRDLQADPVAFRQALLIDADGRQIRLGDVLDPWQQTDFEALDPGWRSVAGQDVEAPRLRGYLERPRGHAKTADLAVMATWALFASRRKLTGYAAAADRDQSGLLRSAIERLVRLNPWLAPILKVDAWKITNIHTGSTLEILSSDAPTSYGLTPDFLIVDELAHWQNRDLWDSLISSAAKRARCMVVAISNAGFSQSWVWTVRENIRNDPAWYFSRLEGPQASWITADRLAEQRRLLPAIAFNRLWLNQWSAGSGDALSSDDIAAALALPGPLNAPEPGWAYTAGVDLGLSRDASAVVVIGRHVGYAETRTKKLYLSAMQRAMIDAGLREEPEEETSDEIEPATGRYKLAAVKLWKPTDGKRVSVEGVERAILRLDSIFGLRSVGCDPWQAAMLTERLGNAGLPIQELPFTGSNLQGMCSAVLEAFGERTIELFDHPTLLADLHNLRIVEKSYGVRLDSPRGASGHGDAATALAIALHLARSQLLTSSGIVGKLLLN